MIPILGEKKQQPGASRVITLPEMQFTDWGKEEIAKLSALKNRYQKRKTPLISRMAYMQLMMLGLLGAAPTAWTATVGASPSSTRGYILGGQMGNILTGSAFKVALFLSTSNLTTTSTLYSALTNEVGITNTGYSTGGIAITFTMSGTPTITVTYTAASVVWTAGSANLVARFAVIYQVAGSYIMCYCTLDSTPADVTIFSGNTLTINPNASGVFTLG